jgi:flavin reductase (DIM6/NTAB) family NADH-FMN oxidoreductase RutF
VNDTEIDAERPVAAGVPGGGPIDPRAYRAVLSLFPTGVTVVTATGLEGQVVGMTVNSFTSVSARPPLVLYCASHQSSLYPSFAAARTFAINILGEGQVAVSRRFASPGKNRFGTIEPAYERTHTPLLPEALATLQCVSRQRIEAGDHDIIIGEVTAMRATPPRALGPLVFYRGAYHHLENEPTWWSVVLG